MEQISLEQRVANSEMIIHSLRTEINRLSVLSESEKANRIIIVSFGMGPADTEVKWALPQGCRWFTLHVRDGTEARIAVEPGLVAGSRPPYLTLNAGSSWNEKDFKVSLKLGYPLYFACSTAGKFVEAMVGLYDPSFEEVR